MDLSEPLAYRMRPQTLDEYVGQEHILGKDKILYRTIKADRLSSIILWGPPGCGNKLQQDALLPYVENGTVILIGATTENPYFEVNKALISRSMVFKLEPLNAENIFRILKRSLISKNGLGNYKIKIEDETIRKIAEVSNGDVRTALNGLEVAVLTTRNARRWIYSYY